MFPRNRGTAQANLTYRYFRPILTVAGIPHIRLYDLRHSHATLLLAAHESLKVVSQRLGHSTIRLTADTYTSVLESMQQGKPRPNSKTCSMARRPVTNPSPEYLSILLWLEFPASVLPCAGLLHTLGPFLHTSPSIAKLWFWC